jgi:hypothetical protein
MTNQIKELKEKIATMQHNLKVLEQLEASKTDVEKAYRDAYGHYPETSGFAMGDWDAVSWEAFQKGYEAAQSKNAEPYCPDDPEYYDEVEWDEKDNPKPKTIRSIIDRWWMDTFTTHSKWDAEECIDDLADQIEFFYMRNKK